METKVCFVCKKEKSIDNFRKNKRNRDGLNGTCRECCTIYARKHRNENKDKYREYVKKYSQSEKGRDRHRKFRKTDKFKKIQERFRNKPENKFKMHIYTTTKEYRQKIKDRINLNLEYYREKRREYDHKRNQIPEVKIKRSLRARLKTLLKRSHLSNSEKTVVLIGCTMPFLKKYLESLWGDGMNWSNYGRNGWHIDHIIPCAVFDLTDIEQQKKCFHYTNLKPAWAFDNLSKGAKYNGIDYRNGDIKK